MPQVKMAAVVSRNPATADLVGPACRIYQTWQALFDAEEIDGVIIATPPSWHAAIAEAALQRDLPVLLEKPIALTVENADRLIKLAAAKATIIHVDHTDLRNPAFIELRQYLASPTEILGLRGGWSNHGPVRRDIRGLWDYGAHAIAICIDLMGGQPDAIEANWVSWTDQIELAAICLKWGAVTAEIEAGNAGLSRTRWLEIDTTKHRLRYDDIVDPKATVDGQQIPYPEISPLTAAVERFVKAIRRGGADIGDLELGGATVTTLAAVQAALEGSQ